MGNFATIFLAAFVPSLFAGRAFHHPGLKSAGADFKRPLLEKRRGVPSFVAKHYG